MKLIGKDNAIAVILRLDTAVLLRNTPFSNATAVFRIRTPLRG